MTLVVENAVLEGRAVSLTCERGVITALGDSINSDRTSDHTGEVLDAHGMALLPGLVNGHTHAAMTLLRGYASDMQLQEWLHDWIFPAESHLTEEDIYWGTRLAAVEMLRSGTVHFFDMYIQSHVVAQAVADSGIRATIGEALFDRGDPEELDNLREAAETSVERLCEFGGRVRPSLAPHSIYLVHEPALAWVGQFSTRENLPIQIHFCETVREVDDWLARHPERPVEYLARLGLLHERTLLAHSCVLDESDFATIAECGATVVTNPVSNAKLAGGQAFPYVIASRAGTHIGLGTDGAASNNSLDILSDVKVFSLIQKHVASDPTVLPATEALEVAQGRCSPLLAGRPVELGGPADFLLVDTMLPEMTPGNLADNLVYSATGAVVDTTVVDGSVVMRHRQVAEQDHIIGEVRRCAARLRH